MQNLDVERNMADQTVIDLRSERSNPPFVVDELTHFYDGGPQATKKRKFICKPS